jgi:hypothetical protein
MNKLLGYAPDLPTTTPGILVDCENFIPYESGMEAAKSATSYSDALAAACLGAFVGTKLDGSRRVFAGTSTRLYELSTTSWTDRSRAGNYSLGATSRWSFAQFGDTSLAANLDNIIQSSSAGAFADISGSPQAAIIEAVLTSGGGQVLAFNTIDGTYGTRPDAWWCCALNDQTSWTPSITSQAATGRLLGFEGKITAARKLGADRIVAYKAGSMYLGSYVGSPGVWSWQELPGFGCVGLDAVANLGTAHFVVGEDNIYLFDGARPIPIAQDVRQWFIDNSSGTYRYRTVVMYDRDNNIIRIFFPQSASSDGTPDRCLVYHLLTQQWGRNDMSIEAGILFSAPTDTFDTGSGTFDADTGTFDDVAAGNKVPVIFNTSHVLCLLSGTPGSSSITLHDVGDDTSVSHLTKAVLRYMTQPSSASVSAFSSMATGGSLTTGPVQSAYDIPANGSNQFPLRQTGRWHRLKFNFTGNTQVVGYDAPLNQAGRR